jgi:hypothetical protein
VALVASRPFIPSCRLFPLAGTSHKAVNGCDANRCMTCIVFPPLVYRSRVRRAPRTGKGWCRMSLVALFERSSPVQRHFREMENQGRPRHYQADTTVSLFLEAVPPASLSICSSVQSQAYKGCISRRKLGKRDYCC